MATSSVRAETIIATQDEPDTIRIVVPAVFETTFTKRKGFGATWFDLKHDPQRKHDLAPVLDENGLLWVKVGRPQADASWYANPPREMKLLEAGPTRVRVRLSGAHQRWNEGYEDKDLRAGLDIMTRWPDQTLPKGSDHISLLLCFRDDLNGHQAAAAYANDYRSPDRLNVSEGVLDTSDRRRP